MATLSLQARPLRRMPLSNSTVAVLRLLGKYPLTSKQSRALTCPPSPTDAVTNIFNSIGAKISSEETSQGTLVTSEVACSTNSSVGFRFPSSNVSTANNSLKAQIFNVALEVLLVPSTNGGDENCTISLVGQDFAELPGLWVLGQSKLIEAESPL